jgi:hypothetical protein
LAGQEFFFLAPHAGRITFHIQVVCQTRNCAAGAPLGAQALAARRSCTAPRVFGTPLHQRRACVLDYKRELQPAKATLRYVRPKIVAACVTDSGTAGPQACPVQLRCR